MSLHTPYRQFAVTDCEWRSASLTFDDDLAMMAEVAALQCGVCVVDVDTVTG